MVMAGSPALLRHVTARTGPAFTVLAMVFALCLASRLLPGGGKALFDGPASLLNVMTSCSVPAGGRRADRALGDRDAQDAAAASAYLDAAFTIYMVHFPIILALDLLIDPLRLNPYVSYLLLVDCRAGLYLVHRLIVRRFPSRRCCSTASTRQDRARQLPNRLSIPARRGVRAVIYIRS